MAETTFNAGISGRSVVAAPQASHGGTNNFYFANDGASKPRKPFSTVPFRPDPDFVERPSIMAWLRDKCSQPASRAALVGLGGIGKSQLAVHFAHEIRQGSPNTYVFWVHTSTRTRFEDAYRSIAERLQLPRLSDPNVNVLQLVYDWLCTEENGKWLMVLDNADDADVFYPTPKPNQSLVITSTAQRPLASFLPQSSNGMILVTSRNQDVAERLTGSIRSVLSIKGMDEHQAQQLLRNKLQESYDEAVAPDLLDALEYMPLAITQAAAYILQRRPRMSPAKYLDEFRRSERKRASLLSRNMGDLRRDPSASNSIVTTWQMTFDKIRHERPSAANLLVFMSFFDPQQIPEWILRSYQRSGGSEDDTSITSSIQSSQNDSCDDSKNDSEDCSENDEFEDDLDMLRLSSLVAVTAQVGVLKMHALVQFCTRLWLSSFDSTRKWRRRFLRVLSRKYPIVAHENWAKCRQLDPHVDMVFENRTDDEEDAKNLAVLLTKAGSYQSHMGLYEVAKKRLSKAVNIRQKVLGDNHPKTLLSISLLAVILLQQGKYKEAEQIYRQMLNSRIKALIADNPYMTEIIGIFISSLQFQGKHEEAEQVSRETFNSTKGALGEEHPVTLGIMDYVSTILGSQKKHKEAEQMSRQTLDSKKRVLGEEHPDTLISANNLACSLRAQGKNEEAEEINRQTLDSRKRISGEEHPDTLTSADNLADSLRAQGKNEEAEQINRQTLDSRKRVLGEEHPHTLTSADNLADSLRAQGKNEEAEQLNRQTLDSRKRVLGEEHPLTLTNADKLADSLRAQGKYEEAEQLNRQTLDSRKRISGEDHLATIASMFHLALVLLYQKRLEETKEIMRQILDNNKKTFGEEHSYTLKTMMILSDILEKCGTREKAIRKTLDSREKLLGEEHPETLESVFSLAYVLQLQGHLDEANELYDRAWKGYKRTLGPDNPTTTACGNRRSFLRKQMGLE